MDDIITKEDMDLEGEMKQVEGTKWSDHFAIYSPFRVDAAELSNHEGLWNDYVLRASRLPESLQDILTSINTINFILELSEDFDLSDEQSTDLTRIIRDVILGDLFIGDMAATMAQKLTIELPASQNLQEKIRGEFFAPAIEDIKKIQREKFPDRVGQGSTAKPDLPPPPQMKGAPPVNQNNIVDLRNRT